MTSKEALDYLASKVFTGGNSILETEAEICANIIKQDLEQKEVLEKENKKAQTYFIETQRILNSDINNLLTENKSLKKGLETLVIKNNLLQEDCDSIADTNVLLSKGNEYLKQENEKLKKAIEILIREKIKPSAFLGILKEYKYHNKVDLPYEKVSIYLDCELTKQEYELLKEVLGE